MKILNHDQFSYLYDQGNHVVALIDRRSFHVDRGDELGLGENGEEGSYVVEAPSLQGCWCVIKSRQTVGKALEDIREVVQMAVAARQKEGKPLPKDIRPASDGTSPLRLTLTVSPR